jgi:hypothetical protein
MTLTTRVRKWRIGVEITMKSPATQRDRQSGADFAAEWRIGAPAGVSLTPENSSISWPTFGEGFRGRAEQTTKVEIAAPAAALGKSAPTIPRRQLPYLLPVERVVEPLDDTGLLTRPAWHCR